MKEAGDLVLFKFPYTDGSDAKFRPAILIKKLPGDFDDWLIVLVSSKIYQCIEGVDIVLDTDDEGFFETGLKQKSLVRVSRLAVVNGKIFEGRIGKISKMKLEQIKANLVQWLK